MYYKSWSERSQLLRSVLIHLRKGLPTTLKRLKDGVPTEILGTSRLEAKIDDDEIQKAV